MKHLGTTWNLPSQLCVLQCVSFHQHHLKKLGASSAVKSDTDCNKKPSCDTQDPSNNRQRLPRFPWQQHLPSRHRVKTAECAMKSIKAGLGAHENHGEIMGKSWCWNIYLQNWAILGVNVSKYTIHGAYGIYIQKLTQKRDDADDANQA